MRGVAGLTRLLGKRPAGRTARPGRQRNVWGNEPPECPAGWTIGPPDFVILGAQKAGTTWWFRMMSSHPTIHVELRRPELHVFDRITDGWLTDDDIARYQRFFPRPVGCLTGEKTPEYLARDWVPAMLRRAAPEARLVVLVRDPVERFRSGLVHTEQSLAQRGVEPARVRGLTIDDAYHRGLYAAQLARVTAVFPTEQCLLLQFEQCIRDPQPQLDRVFQFLGLPTYQPPPDLRATSNNRSRQEKRELAPERRQVLVDNYTADVLALQRSYPQLDLRLWPNFAHLAPPAGREPKAAVAPG